MPITVKNVLRKIRGIPKPEVRRSAIEDAFAQVAGQERKNEIAASQNAVVAKREYDAMMREIAEIQKEEMARMMVEQKRQFEINKVRLKNLKKARKAKLMKKRGKK
jgi:hypothetical protein